MQHIQTPCCFCRCSTAAMKPCRLNHVCYWSCTRCTSTRSYLPGLFNGLLGVRLGAVVCCCAWARTC
jgi:hypothetical protein